MPFNSLIVLQQGCYGMNIVIDLLIVMNVIRKLHMKATSSYMYMYITVYTFKNNINRKL